MQSQRVIQKSFFIIVLGNGTQVVFRFNGDDVDGESCMHHKDQSVDKRQDLLVSVVLEEQMLELFPVCHAL